MPRGTDRATVAANVAHGLGHGPVGAVVAAWPVVALVGSYELLMMVNDPEPRGEQAAEIAGQLAADRVPSVRSVCSCMLAGRGCSGCGDTSLQELECG
jgi:hypothetical protein